MPQSQEEVGPLKRRRRGAGAPPELSAATLPPECNAGLLLEALEFLKVTPRMYVVIIYLLLEPPAYYMQQLTT